MKNYLAIFLVLAFAVLPPLYGCKRHRLNSGGVSTWSVYNKAGKEVLRVKNVPGPLISTAVLPPNTPPVLNPFLSATALDPFEEDALRDILEKSRNFDEFIGNLKKSGYTVVRRKAGL